MENIFEKNSWDTHYLGADTPSDELVRFCELVKPDLICLSLSVYANILVLLGELWIEIIVITSTPIIIGGQALKRVGVELCKSLDNVLTYLSNLERW